ncbi:MAG TPA: LysM domain-containing protein [Gaiellaceae bacterium]|nr:LysM domain-containing protein [Gaiellaceae bacterium]
MNPDKLRIWVARLAAPLVFFFAAVILVVLVQRALDREEDTSSNASASNTETTDTGATTTTTGVTETTDLPRGCRKRNYRVRPGDTLEVIAARCETTVDVLLELNPNIDPLALSPGQKVHLRARAT